MTEVPAVRRNDVAEDTQSSLVADARLLLDACGIVRGGNWISRTVRAYLDSRFAGLPFGHYLLGRVEANAQQRAAVNDRADLRYLLDYVDPTGESAMRNVMRERGY